MEFLRYDETGEIWLAVDTLNKTGRHAGRSADGATALDFVGTQSWVYGSKAYLAEDDAYRYLDAIGSSEGDPAIGWRWILRPPNGYRTVRDSDAADYAAAVSDGNAYFGRLAAEATAPDDHDDSHERRWSKQENRALAAELRALGFVPNGDVWAQAKGLRAAGEGLDSLRKVTV